MSKLKYFLAMNGISTCKLAQRGHYMVRGVCYELHGTGPGASA